MTSMEGLPSSIASSVSAVALLPANLGRKGAAIFNDSTQVLYLLCGSAAPSSANYTVKIAASGYYEVPYRYTGPVNGVWASANGNARVTEFT